MDRHRPRDRRARARRRRRLRAAAGAALCGTGGGGGAAEAGALGVPSAASRAMVWALERSPLVVLALGPLTNVTTALRDPAAPAHVERVVEVAERRPGQRFQVGTGEDALPDFTSRAMFPPPPSCWTRTSSCCWRRSRSPPTSGSVSPSCGRSRPVRQSPAGWFRPPDAGSSTGASTLASTGFTPSTRWR